MKKSIFAIPLAFGLCASVQAKSVTSDYVSVLGPEEVFAPIPDATGNVDISRLVDTPVVFDASYAKDFEVDGDLEKKVWANVPAYTEFLSVKGKTKFPYKTEMKLRYSSKALYLGFTLYQPMEDLRAQYDQDDQPIFNDDNVELLFYVPSRLGENMLHVCVNALGSCYDAINDRKVWTLRGRKIKTKRFKDRWTLEMRVPYTALGIEQPIPGDYIGFRACRFLNKPWARTSAPQLLTTGNVKRGRFGKLLFGETTDEVAAEAKAWRAESVKKRVASRLESAKKLLVAHEACTAFFGNQEHSAYNEAGRAINQLKTGLLKFEEGKLSTNGFFALEAGYRKYAASKAYVAWPASLWEKGDPNRVPPADCRTLPTLKFEQAGNEREALCLEFSGVLCGSGLDLRLVPQTINRKGKNPAFVSCDSFEIYEEPFIRYEKEIITAPLVRKPGNIITLTPGKVTRVWIVFNSRGVMSGDYQTKILLKPAYDVNVAEQALDVEMKVWNFTLPETRDWPFQTFFWGPNFFDNNEVQALKLMHDCHVTHGWTKSQLYRFGIHKDQYAVRRPSKDDPVYFDKHLAETANEEFFRTAKNLGMRFVFGWGTPDRTPEWFQIMDNRLRKMGFKPGDYIFKTLIKDEFMKHHIPINAEKRAAVTKEFGTNLWFQAVYLSTPPPTGATIEDIEEAKLPEFYKMWMIIHGVFKDKERGEDITRRLRAKGCKVWSYRCSLYMQTRDILNYYRFYLWDSYMRGLDGVGIWCSGTRQGDDGFDSRDGYDDGITWYGNDKQQIPTKRLQAFREGLEDIAYMDALSKAIAKAKESKRDVTKAQALLDERASVIEKADFADVDRWRLETGRMIDALNARPAEKNSSAGKHGRKNSASSKKSKK